MLEQEVRRPSDPPHVAQKMLAGLRVLDVATFIAAPFCETILGDFGAEVIKIEQPGQGDPHVSSDRG